jgi:hypothetical protein
MTVLYEIDLTDMEVAEFDAFMQEASGMSANSAARVMESVVPTVNFHRCGKRRMAEVWAARNRKDPRFSQYRLGGKPFAFLKAAFDTERQYQQDRAAVLARHAR